MVKTYTTELAGRPLVMEFGKYCGQANGSVIVRLGDTVVMVSRRPDAFTEDFTEEKLASVLFSLMLSALLRQDYDPSTVLEMVRRLIY